jgi:hypothetical protein
MAVNYTDIPFFKSITLYYRYLPTGRQVYQMQTHKAMPEISAFPHLPKMKFHLL